MSKDSETKPESESKAESKLVGRSIPGSTSTGDVTAEKTPISTEEQDEDSQK